jgi:hypothetical protein
MEMVGVGRWRYYNGPEANQSCGSGRRRGRNRACSGWKAGRRSISAPVLTSLFRGAAYLQEPIRLITLEFDWLHEAIGYERR